MKTIKFHQIAILIFTLLFSATVWAAPTSGTPYNNDPQNEYVQDATSDAIGTVNMVLCIVNGMNISGSGMLNVGPYIALIDMNKCQSHGGSSGASSAVNYMTAVVDATRASDTAPMIANVWMSMTEQGHSQDIYVKLTATTPPSASLPYGVFRLDFLGKDSNGYPQMNGFIDSSSGSLKYFESGTNSNNVSLNMAAGSTVTGNGVMTVGVSSNNPTAATYNFNYDTNYFRRSDTVHDQCFDRAKANAKRSVWRYGTYKDSDGTRVDQPNPSFQLTGTFGGSSYYGYASYYGIGFQGLDLNSTSVTNATNATTGLVNGLVVTDQRPGHTTDTFSLSKVGGKLTKWTQNTTPLSAMDGIPFNYFGNLSAVTTPAVANSYQSWQLQWDNANSRFIVLGTQSCGSTGCSLAPVATSTVTTSAFDSTPISGWSDAFGGNINIPSATTRSGSTVVSYFSQATVTPGSTTLTLRCLNNCPDVASVAATVSYSSGTQIPFGGTTASQWFSALNLAATVLYSFDGTGLNIGGTTMIINNPLYFASGTSYQYGVMTGRLFDASGSAIATDMIATCGAGVCEPSNPSVYYTWTTGANQWNQSMWLTRTSGTNSGAIVAFDPPQIIQYTVPSGAAYGSLSGKAIQLQFNGFGNLSGIPGNCVSPVDNSVVDCSTANSRYVPAFSIPDAATMSLNGTTIIVKALDAEIRLNDLGVGAAACSGMSLTTTLIPPDGTGVLGIHDVSAAMGTYSVGNKPAFTAAPKVIDGVVQ